jgi:hypothetical protein
MDMSRTEQAKEMIRSHREMLLREFVDLMTAASEIAQELKVTQIFHSVLDGKTRVHFYDNFPFDGEEVKRRTIKIRDGYERDELYVEHENVEFSWFVPTEEER